MQRASSMLSQYSVLLLLQLLDYPGRPALSTLDNNTPCPKAALLEYIHAVQTRPFSMTTSSSSSAGTGDDSGSSSSGSSRGGLSAAWDEELSVDMSPQQLVEGDALLLLEVLQLPGGFSRYKVKTLSNNILTDTKCSMLLCT